MGQTSGKPTGDATGAPTTATATYNSNIYYVDGSKLPLTREISVENEKHMPGEYLECERPEYPDQIPKETKVKILPATAEQIRAAVAEAATYPRLLREDREREAQENIRRTAVRVGRNKQAILRGGLSSTRRQ